MDEAVLLIPNPQNAVGVILHKVVGNRAIEKRINVRIEHVRHSRSRDEFLNRAFPRRQARELANIFHRRQGERCQEAESQAGRRPDSAQEAASSAQGGTDRLNEGQLAGEHHADTV